MSHVLRPSEMHGTRVGIRRALVKVRRDGPRLVIEGFLGVSRVDEPFVLLPKRVLVVEADGTVVAPSEGQRFFVSVRSFDPYHAVCQISEEDF